MMPRLQVFEVAASVEGDAETDEQVAELRVFSAGLEASEASLREFSAKLEQRVSSTDLRTPLNRQFSKAS
jgi:hypothetical protein